MILAYLGPGVGIGGLIVLIGLAFTALFLFYAFVFLPLRKVLTRRKDSEKQ